MAKTSRGIFNTDRRIRLGIWGLGRGMNFYRTCRFLNIDVVAGCDFNDHMRARFLAENPESFVTADAEEFLAQEFDAVLLATFCPSHAADAIRCLQAGKHVLSEVTAFFTMAEGVRLVEEVERRGLVYQLAENYPFSAANMWLANRWREGLFGELMYAEYEYVHECRSLAYTYIDGLPVQPGHTVHNWRSWFNFHYYCTHSLGPVMTITGTRPTRVEALPSRQCLAGYLPGDHRDGVTPSLITMNNGGIVRNLMGATTNDSHQQRLWGTLGAAEQGHDGLHLRLGASGGSPKFRVTPCWEGLGELAAQTGHGGGDFWTLYYFAREILTGERGPFDIYGAADVTIPGLLACRSATQDGQPFDVPDFRLPAARAPFRSDEWQLPRYEVQRGVFAGAALDENARQFSTVMRDLIRYSTTYRAYADWKKVLPALTHPEEFLPVAQRLLADHAALCQTYTTARAIITAYPSSDGATVLGEMLAVGGEAEVMQPDFLPVLTREVGRLRRKYATNHLELKTPRVSKLLPHVRIDTAPYPDTAVRFSPAARPNGYVDVRPAHHGATPGLVYVRGWVTMPAAGAGTLTFGADGPVRLFFNGQAVACEPRAVNPILPARYSAAVTWTKGKNEVLFALDVRGGQAWGVVVASLTSQAE
jgi:hypothetical protein